jgi:hypothetical protein
MLDMTSIVGRGPPVTGPTDRENDAAIVQPLLEGSAQTLFTHPAGNWQ